MEDYSLARWAKRSNRFVHFLVPAEEVQENETQEWLGRLKETEKKVHGAAATQNHHHQLLLLQLFPSSDAESTWTVLCGPLIAR